MDGLGDNRQARNTFTFVHIRQLPDRSRQGLHLANLLPSVCGSNSSPGTCLDATYVALPAHVGAHRSTTALSWYRWLHRNVAPIFFVSFDERQLVLCSVTNTFTIQLCKRFLIVHDGILRDTVFHKRAENFFN